MNLYLMRHANAGLSRVNPLLDNKRALIKEGKEQCVLMARAVSALNVQIDVIVSSPLKRALQTAQFVGTELGFDSKVEISPALGLQCSYPAFQDLLAKYADREGVLAVGHNPNLFQFLGRLLTGNGGANLRMRKGVGGARGPGPPSPAIAVADGSAHGAHDLCQRGKELAPENFAK